MKIVDPQPFRFEFSCPECDSKLEAEAKDVRYFYSDGVIVYYVSCPLCKARKTVPYSKTNPLVREMAHRKG